LMMKRSFISAGGRTLCTLLRPRHLLRPATAKDCRFLHATHARGNTSGELRSSTPGESLEQEMQRLASYAQTSITLKATVDTGLGMFVKDDSGAGDLTKRQRMLIQIASFLRRELPLRLARRAIELQNLPEGLHSMPSVTKVKDWHVHSYVEIRQSRPPTCEASELEFYKLLQGIYERHAPTLVTMAKGVHELKMSLTDKHGPDFEFGDVTDIHNFLDKFYMSRVGIRILIGQYLELHRDPQMPGYVGLINRNTLPTEICAQAIEEAKYMCVQLHGDTPEVVLYGRTDLTFSYIPSHLYYCMFEILKNSLRAVAEHHGVNNTMPPVKVIIADGENNEDVVIKISDEGGGIPRSHMPRIWSYLFTTAPPAFEREHCDLSSSSGDHGANDAPLAGLGYGLPISRGYARYFGGDLNMMSMEGFGTDAFLHLPRLGNKSEPLP